MFGDSNGPLRGQVYRTVKETVILVFKSFLDKSLQNTLNSPLYVQKMKNLLEYDSLISSKGITEEEMLEISAKIIAAYGKSVLEEENLEDIFKDG